MAFQSTPPSSKRFVYVENNGRWERGKTYTVRAGYFEWSDNDGNPIYNDYYAQAKLATELDFCPNTWEHFIFDKDKAADWGIKDAPFDVNYYTTIVFRDPNLYAVDFDNGLWGSGDSENISGDYPAWDRAYIEEYQITIPADAPLGRYKLIWGHWEYTIDYTTLMTVGGTTATVTSAQERHREYYTISICSIPVSPLIGDRPATYDEDKVWGEDNTGEFDWLDGTTAEGAEIMAIGGGRYENRFVTVTDKGEIFFK